MQNISLQDARVVPLLSVVKPDPVMKSKEKDLANAVLAIDISPATANPSVRDIYLADAKQFSNVARPTSVTPFYTDFVIQFATPQERDFVLCFCALSCSMAVVTI